MPKGKEDKKDLWFRRKTYGWGWCPCSWKGWLVIFIWAIIFAISITGIEKNDHELGKNFAVIFIITAILLGICYKKGEKPKWQWGKNGRK